MRKTNQELEQILVDSFYSVYPKDRLPGWFHNHARFDFFPNMEKKVLELNVYLNKPKPLDEHYFWEENNGRKDLVHVNKETGEKMYVIAYDDQEPFYVFRAYLDRTLKATVTEKMDDISELKEEDFNIRLQGKTIRN